MAIGLLLPTQAKFPALAGEYTGLVTGTHHLLRTFNRLVRPSRCNVESMVSLPCSKERDLRLDKFDGIKNEERFQSFGSAEAVFMECEGLSDWWVSNSDHDLFRLSS